MTEYKTASAEIRMGISNTFEQLFSDELGLNHQRRLEAYRQYWLAYLGKHWSYQRDPGESQEVINYCRKAIDSHVNFGFSKGFKTLIKDDPSTAENEAISRDFIRLLLEETWEMNSKELWLLDGSQQGAITGDVFARVSWDRAAIYDEPYSRVDMLPSHLCFPEFGGPHGVDKKTLKRLLVVIPSFEDVDGTEIEGGRVVERNLDGTRIKLVMNAELWTSPVLSKDRTEVVTPAKVFVYKDGVVVEERENPLGEIPVVHIPNYPVSGEYYGISDLADVVDLNVEINTRVTDVGEIIDYHGSPQTIVKGAKLSQLERGTNRIWGIPADAEVSNLELSGDLGAANEHIRFLKEAFRELTSSPEHFWGKSQAVSNTSAAALQMLYLPVMEKRGAKVLTYSKGLERINRLILKTNELADPAFREKMSKVGRNRYRNTVEISDPMPRDEVRRLEKEKLEMEMGINSRRNMLLERGLTSVQVDERLAEADKDKEKDLAMQFQTSGSSFGGIGSGNGNMMRGGSDETRGEKIADTVAEKDE